jgi:hypothetical protein
MLYREVLLLVPFLLGSVTCHVENATRAFPRIMHNGGAIFGPAVIRALPGVAPDNLLLEHIHTDT